MSKKLDRYKRECDNAQAQVCRYEDKEKILDYQMQQEKRKERTHRLCTRAGRYSPIRNDLKNMAVRRAGSGNGILTTGARKLVTVS